MEGPRCKPRLLLTSLRLRTVRCCEQSSRQSGPMEKVNGESPTRVADSHRRWQMRSPARDHRGPSQQGPPGAVFESPSRRECPDGGAEENAPADGHPDK